MTPAFVFHCFYAIPRLHGQAPASKHWRSTWTWLRVARSDSCGRYCPALAAGLSDRVLHRFCVRADSEHGVQGVTDGPIQVHSIHGTRWGGRALRSGPGPRGNTQPAGKRGTFRASERARCPTRSDTRDGCYFLPLSRRSNRLTASMNGENSQSMPPLDLTVGQKATRAITLTADHVTKYAEITGDRNPLHFAERCSGRTDDRAVARPGRHGHARAGDRVPQSRLEVHGTSLHRGYHHRYSGGSERPCLEARGSTRHRDRAAERRGGAGCRFSCTGRVHNRPRHGVLGVGREGQSSRCLALGITSISGA